VLLPIEQGIGDIAQAGDMDPRPQAEDDLLEQVGDPGVIFENHHAHDRSLIL
jgi:hypothetical protein